MSTNFVGNTLTQSEAIETYTPYDVTSSRPRKMKIAFFANFGGTEKLFCALEQSLNSKIMDQCKRGLKFHFIGTLILIRAMTRAAGQSAIKTARLGLVSCLKPPLDTL